MRARKKITLAIALVALSLVLWKHYLGSVEVSAKASFGYDDEGKFIALTFDSPVYLRKVVIGSEEFPVEKMVEHSYALRYNWREDREYSMRLEHGRGDLFVQGTAPRVEPRLDVETRFYHAYYGGERVAVAETRAFSIGNEEIRAYFTGAGEVVERVRILRYPPVLTSPGVYEDFVKKLREELRKLGVRAEVSRELGEGEMLIVAGGAWPLDLNRTRSIIYIGGPPGEVLVRGDGSLAMGRTWESILPRPGRMRGGMGFRESAYTATSPERVVAYREDGLPGVFKVGGALVFSNTLDMGWESVDDAVDDVVKAVITWGFMPSAERSYRLDGDARNLTFILHAKVGNESGRLGLALASERTGEVVVKNATSGSARMKGPRSAYPGEEVLLTAYLPATPQTLGVEVTGEGGGSAELETRATQGVDVRRIRAVFTLPGEYLVKVTGDGEVLGAALVHIRRIMVEPLRIETGVRGRLTLMITDDGEPYTGEAGLQVAGDEVFRGRLKEGVLRYLGSVPGEASVTVMVQGKGYMVDIPEAGLLPGWFKPHHAALTILMALAAAFSVLARERRSRVVIMEMPGEVGAEAVHVKAASVLRVFDLYNRRMHWEKLPLTLEEVQRALYLFGVSKGYPSRGSVARLLEREMNLSIPEDERWVPEKLCVRKAYGYYAPYNWEDKSQRIEHLAMVRAAYEWMVRNGVECKALTASDYTEGYPDVLGVASQKIMEAVFEKRQRWEETVLLVECETGDKPEGDSDLEKLAHALSEKYRAFTRKPVEDDGGEPDKAEPPKAGESKEQGATKPEKPFNYRHWLLRDAVLVFVLSPGLHAAYEALMEDGKSKEKDVLHEVLAAIKKKEVLVYSAKEVAVPGMLGAA